MKSDYIRLAIRVRGRVQGVGYRYFALQTAKTFGVTGWVRNCDKGDVELEAQASTNAIQSFCEALKNGPEIGFVTELLSTEIPIIDAEQSFRIQH